MVKPKDKSVPAVRAGDRPAVRIVVLPNNVAWIDPAVEQLPPLLPYRDFLYAAAPVAAPAPGAEPRRGPEPPTRSAFPAGLVPRFEAALAGAGYQVSVADQRPSEPAIRVNTAFVQDSHGVAREFLRAVVGEPLGQVEFEGWYDLVWRARHLCAVFPEARTLLAADSPWTVDELRAELAYGQRLAVGRIDGEPINQFARCVAVGPSWLPRLRPGLWEVLILIVFRGRNVSAATYRAVARLGARRVYALRASGLRLGKPTGLRLEALAGAVIGPPAGFWGDGDTL